MNNILIIDDDQELCALLQDYFRIEGLKAEAVFEPVRGIDLALTGRYDLLVLDVMLPTLSGFETLRRIRAGSQVPVLMLTACGDDMDRIQGLETGADDYLQKPFNPRELVARIRAILRRAGPSTEELGVPPSRLAVEDVELVPSARTVFQGGKPLALTSVEFSTLETLLLNAGKVISREDMVKSVLGRELSPFDRSIDVHVSNLRKKLGPKTDGSERIKTLRGVGYLYAVQ